MQYNACYTRSMQYDALDIETQAGTRKKPMALALTIRVRTAMMDGLDAGVFSGGGLFLICSSTYGQGDVPDNAKNLYESLRTARPDLSDMQYGVIALGDRTYAETFCNGGKRFDAILSELGARRIGEVMLHDASAGTMPEEVAVAWVAGWISLCRKDARLTA